MKIFISAYACEPDRGSEPGVGWGWVNALAEHAEVTVVTRANNQEVIEAWYRKQGGAGKKPVFEYFDPPAWILGLKRRRWITTQLFYAIWQVGVIARFRKRLNEHDLIHHLTFNSMMLPGFWWRSPVPVVLGPLGGTSLVARDYASLFGARFMKERWRSFLIRHWKCLPWLRLSFRRANLILCSNSETTQMLSGAYPEKTATMLEIGMDRGMVAGESRNERDEKSLELIWIGTMEPWKGWSMALEALAKARRELGDEVKLHMTMLGRGSEEAAAGKLASDLGLQENVSFLQRVSFEELNHLISSAGALIFSSVKDTSGTVVLEAMSHGKAVACIRHQGVKDMTTKDTAIRVEPGSLEDTVEGFTSAMVRLARDPELCRNLGEAGRERVLAEYTWEHKAMVMMEHYQALSGISRDPHS